MYRPTSGLAPIHVDKVLRLSFDIPKIIRNQDCQLEGLCIILPKQQCRYTSSSVVPKPTKAVKRNPQFPHYVDRIITLTSTRGPIIHENSKQRLMQYLKSSPSLSQISRTSIINVLFQSGAYKEILEIYKLTESYNLAQNTSIPKDITLDELRAIGRSLVLVQDFQGLDAFMKSSITKYSTNFDAKKKVLIKLLNSVLKQLYDTCELESYFEKWIQYYFFMQGHVYFDKLYIANRLYLKPFKFVVVEDCAKHSGDKLRYQNILQNLKSSDGISARILAQFLSTFLSVLINSQEWDIAKMVFEYKMQHFEQSLTEFDLNCSLQVYAHFDQFKKLINVYRKYPHLHSMSAAQFDYLLVTLSKLEDWQGLQKQFDDLFYIGELPNIIHYGIIMSKVAKTGHIEIVDKLFTQLIGRGLIPNFHILQSLMVASYNSGDHYGLLKNFQLFEKYEVKPNPTTYLYMLRSYRRRNDMEGALKVLRNMDSDMLNESHFLQMILIASHLMNSKIAEEIFHVMQTDFKIKPSPVFLSKMMQLYNGCKLPEKSIALFNDNIASLKRNPKRISLYNQLLSSHIILKNEKECENVLNEIEKEALQHDPEFNLMMIRFFLSVKDNVSICVDFAQKMHEKNSRMIGTVHLQEIMSHINCRMSSKNMDQSVSQIFQLYKFQLDKRIPVSSEILRYVLKFAYIHNISKFKSGSQLDQFLKLARSFIDKFADKSLDTVNPILHPNFIYFPVKSMSSIDPVKSRELIEYYVNKCYSKQVDQDDLYKEIVLLKVKLFFSFNTGEWNNVSYFFDKILENLLKLKKLPFYERSVNKNLRFYLIDIVDIKLRQLQAQNQISDGVKLFSFIKKNLKMIISNKSHNLLANLLVQNRLTIEQGLKMVENYLIHGHRAVHKLRSLKKLKTPMESKTLMALEENPKQFQPRIYLQSEDYMEIMKSMDSYLIELSDNTAMEQTLEKWCKNYPQTMVRYLMVSRPFPNWEEYEKSHKEFLHKVRKEKYIEK